MFDTKIEMIKITNNNVYLENLFVVPNGSNVEIDPNNPYSGVVETIIAYESVHSIYKLLKRLKHFSSKLDYEFQQNFIITTIDDYKPLLKQLRNLLYRPLCSNLFKAENILPKITSTKWDPNEEEADTVLFIESNTYIDKIYKDIYEKYNELGKLGKLSDKSKKRFLSVGLTYIKEVLMEAYSKIKKVFIVF